MDAIRVEQTVRADSYVEGKVAGQADQVRKGEHIGDNKNSRKVAKRMIIDGVPLEKISRMTELSLEVVAELAQEISEEGERAD